MDTFFWDWKLSALCNLNCGLRLVSWVLWDVLDLLDDLVTFEHLAEDDVLSIEMAVDC